MDVYLIDPDGWTHRLGEITEAVDYTTCGQALTDGWYFRYGYPQDMTPVRCVLGCFP